MRHNQIRRRTLTRACLWGQSTGRRSRKACPDIETRCRCFQAILTEKAQSRICLSNHLQNAASKACWQLRRFWTNLQQVATRAPRGSGLASAPCNSVRCRWGEGWRRSSGLALKREYGSRSMRNPDSSCLHNRIEKLVFHAELGSTIASRSYRLRPKDGLRRLDIHFLNN